MISSQCSQREILRQRALQVWIKIKQIQTYWWSVCSWRVLISLILPGQCHCVGSGQSEFPPNISHKYACPSTCIWSMYYHTCTPLTDWRREETRITCSDACLWPKYMQFPTNTGTHGYCSISNVYKHIWHADFKINYIMNTKKDLVWLLLQETMFWLDFCKKNFMCAVTW